MALHEWVYSHTYNICGGECFISRCAIDAGWNPRAKRREKDYANKNHIVYEFVSLRIDRFIAIMGIDDEKAVSVIKEARITDDQSSLTKRYNIAVSVIKELIMNVIGQKIGYGTIHFPRFTTIEGQSTIGGREGTPYTATVVITDTVGMTATMPVTATAVGHITHYANLLPEKSAPSVIGRGQLLTYTIRVWNSGLSTDDPPFPWLTDTVPMSTGRFFS